VNRPNHAPTRRLPPGSLVLAVARHQMVCSPSRSHRFGREHPAAIQLRLDPSVNQLAPHISREAFEFAPRVVGDQLTWSVRNLGRIASDPEEAVAELLLTLPGGRPVTIQPDDVRSLPPSWAGHDLEIRFGDRLAWRGRVLVPPRTVSGLEQTPLLERRGTPPFGLTRKQAAVVVATFRPYLSGYGTQAIKSAVVAAELRTEEWPLTAQSVRDHLSAVRKKAAQWPTDASRRDPSLEGQELIQALMERRVVVVTAGKAFTVFQEGHYVPAT
jgi:hypothetical protein